MIHELKKFAQQSDITIKFITGWRDDFDNILTVFEIAGKKYALLSHESKPNEFAYCFGMGSTGPQSNAPVGRGNYLIGNKLEQGYAELLSNAINSGSINLIHLQNNNGASWAPANEQQKAKLADLVSVYAGINKQLEQFGITYSEGDRLIFGKDLTPATVTSWTIPQESLGAISPPNQHESSHGFSPASGDTENLKSFIAALAPEFQAEFSAPMIVGSTFRTPSEQAEAMRWPLKSGDFDNLYKTLPSASYIKELILAKKWEEAGAIIGSSPEWMRMPHLQGIGADIPFSQNPTISAGDHKRFQDLIARVSSKTGIRAKGNSEKASHFHITVG